MDVQVKPMLGTCQGFARVKCGAGWDHGERGAMQPYTYVRILLFFNNDHFEYTTLIKNIAQTPLLVQCMRHEIFIKIQVKMSYA